MTTRVRRALSLVGAGALTAGLTVALPAGAAHAATDPAPAAAGVAWLAAQRGDDGLLGASDVTSTMDFAVGLVRTEQSPELVDELRAAVDEVLAETIGAPQDVNNNTKVAAATAFYSYVGDPRDASGVDLVSRLESHVDDATGQLTTAWGVDYFNQSSAVLALDRSESHEAAAATEFLLDGRCADSGWGYDDGTACHPDADTTAVALIALSEQLDDERVAAETAEAAAWLKTQQAADGSFGHTDFTPYNANSTGLAGWALAQLGEADAARAAAVWVRAHQLTGVGPCEQAASSDAGAIAHNDADLAAAARDGIADFERSIFVRAAAQALPVLALAPAAEGELSLVGARGFVRAGSATKVTVTGVAPGERACLTGGKAAVTVTGSGQATVTTKAGTGVRTLTLATADGSATTTVSVLGKAKLKVKAAKKTVTKGKKVKVTVTGLAASEKVKVQLRGKKVAKGKANAKGKFAAKVKVGKKTGKAKLTAVGQFANRKGSAKIRVR